ILAYRQPITRAEIEDIPGVAAGDMLRGLVEKGLVRVAGKADCLGHPLLYGTTKKFMQFFGLKDLKDLPKVGELVGPAKGDADVPLEQSTDAEGQTDSSTEEQQDA
ncbi:MAG: SMC-Scp complex subunit ScpB, partial [Planctomycetia bacterium]|nr:SMC-Scp complex subunit ScpB [Planctomycetia bacterium]